MLLSKTSEAKSEIRDAAVPASAERESGTSYPCFKVVEFDHFKSEAMEVHLLTKISQVEQKRLESE